MDSLISDTISCRYILYCKVGGYWQQSELPVAQRPSLSPVCEHFATVDTSGSARLGDPVPETDIANSPHSPPARRVLAVDVRVEHHVDVLVRDVDRRRAPRTRGAEVTAVRAEELSA